jgi:transposase-like protein
MCPYCSSPCISHGTSSAGNKRYICRSCKRTHSKAYRYIACRHSISYKIKVLLKEGCSILSISRILKIGVNTVLRRIKVIASRITKPLISPSLRSLCVADYEVIMIRNVAFLKGYMLSLYLSFAVIL